MARTTSNKRVRRAVGMLVAVPLGDGSFGFGWLVNRSLMAFFDHRQESETVDDLEALRRTPVLFRVWVMADAIGSGRWRVLGKLEPTEREAALPWFFKQDLGSGDLSLTRDGGEEIPATPEQCRKLERAAVWSWEHVESRLTDHFAGRPNRFVESLKYEG